VHLRRWGIAASAALALTAGNHAVTSAQPTDPPACESGQVPTVPLPCTSTLPVEIDHSDGVDARIILAPSLCARAVVRPDTERLVKVIVLVPCPDKTPKPPTAKPEPGDTVTIIDKQAPKPETVVTELPVTG
jgi:hypothetical protein